MLRWMTGINRIEMIKIEEIRTDVYLRENFRSESKMVNHFSTPGLLRCDH